MQEAKFDYMVEGTEKKMKDGNTLNGFYAVFVGKASDLLIAVESL